jgi:hypothetical protein
MISFQEFGCPNLHTYVYAVFGEEGGAGAKVDSATDSVIWSILWPVCPSMLTGIKYLTVVAVVSPGFWFPTRESRQRNLWTAKAEAYEPISSSAVEVEPDNTDLTPHALLTVFEVQSSICLQPLA